MIGSHAGIRRFRWRGTGAGVASSCTGRSAPAFGAKLPVAARWLAALRAETHINLPGLGCSQDGWPIPSRVEEHIAAMVAFADSQRRV
jgi:hypothetical protein